MVLVDPAINKGTPERSDLSERALLIRAHKSAIANDIAGKNGNKFPLSSHEYNPIFRRLSRILEKPESFSFVDPCIRHKVNALGGHQST
jgi:hypothetical protein